MFRLTYLLLFFSSSMAWTARPPARPQALRVNYSARGNRQPGLCKLTGTGTLPGIEEIGLTDEVLREGVECDRGDYNGDGRADYVFFKCGTASGAECKTRIVFWGRSGPWRAVGVEGRLHNRPETYDRRLQAQKKVFGCPTFKHDALFEDDGRAKSRIYLYDGKLGRFLPAGTCRGENS